MPDQLLQGGGVFEITDHTTASDFERFIANIEEILTEWELHKHSEVDSTATSYKELPPGHISSGLWHERHDVVRFGNVAFDLRYQFLNESNLKKTSNQIARNNDLETGNEQSADEDEQSSTSSVCYEDADDQYKNILTEIPKEKEKEHGEHELPQNAPECLLDLVSTNNDFASKAHCLVRWYNLRRFVILVPRGDTIVSEDRVKLLLSSASVALANIDCHVPIFVQTHNPNNNFFQGISEHSNIRTMYEMVFYKRSLKQYDYLSELISIFREKTGCNLNDPISATARLNYCLDFFDLFVEQKDHFSGNEHSDDDDDDLVKMTSTSLQAKKASQAKQKQNQDMRSDASFEQVKDALQECLPHPYKIMRFLHVAALWPPVSDKVITDSRVHSDLDPSEAPIWTIRCVTSDNCNMKLVHNTQVMYNLLCAATDYAYDKLDASENFVNCDRDSLKASCLELSYKLAVQPEVVLSQTPGDNMRKLVALLFYRAQELRADDEDALRQIAGQLKKRPSLSEVYRDFHRQQRPSVKEFIIRTQVSRPFNPISTPALPQRMFCTICDEEFRLCLACSELCN